MNSAVFTIKASSVVGYTFIIEAIRYSGNRYPDIEIIARRDFREDIRVPNIEKLILEVEDNLDGETLFAIKKIIELAQTIV